MKNINRCTNEFYAEEKSRRLVYRNYLLTIEVGIWFCFFKPARQQLGKTRRAKERKKRKKNLKFEFVWSRWRFLHLRYSVRLFSRMIRYYPRKFSLIIPYSGKKINRIFSSIITCVWKWIPVFIFKIHLLLTRTMNGMKFVKMVVAMSSLIPPRRISKSIISIAWKITTVSLWRLHCNERVFDDLLIK